MISIRDIKGQIAHGAESGLCKNWLVVNSEFKIHSSHEFKYCYLMRSPIAWWSQETPPTQKLFGTLSAADKETVYP